MLDRRSVSCYYDAFGRYRCRNNGFSSWGRWVLLGLIIAVAVCFILCVLCVSRRRARRGSRPFYGTRWAVPNSYNNNNAAPQQPTTYPQTGAYGAGPQYQQPQYQQPQYGATPYQQEMGVTQPKPTYAGEQYAPPAGPPPGHHQAY